MSKEHLITIRDKNGITLATEKKYCARNIRVVPLLNPLTVTENGTYPVPENYAGQGEVIVAVPAKEENTLHISQNGIYTAPKGTVYTRISVEVNNRYNTYDTATYILHVGDSFDIFYNMDNAGFTVPDFLSFIDHGGFISVVAEAPGKDVLKIHSEDEQLIGLYTVEVIEA